MLPCCALVTVDYFFTIFANALQLHRSGVAVYAATLPASLLKQGSQLYVGTAVRDFASIYIDQIPVARIDRTTAHDALAVNLSASVDQNVDQDMADQRMHVVVEAMGHNTFFDSSYPNGAFDLKGLVRPLALNGAAKMHSRPKKLQDLTTTIINNTSPSHTHIQSPRWSLMIGCLTGR